MNFQMAGAGRRYNFHHVQFMIVDPLRSAARLVAQMLEAFGADVPLLVCDPQEAGRLVGARAVHGLIVAMGHDPRPALDLVRCVRGLQGGSERFMPILALAGYCVKDEVLQARDAGADCVLRRPVAPMTLFQRLTWAVEQERLFIEKANYRGPDRRRHQSGPPAGIERRGCPGDITAI